MLSSHFFQLSTKNDIKHLFFYQFYTFFPYNFVLKNNIIFVYKKKETIYERKITIL
jgi:hypothetical protein